MSGSVAAAMAGGAVGGVVGGVGGLALSGGRASVEIDGKRIPLSAEGIEKARLDMDDGDKVKTVGT